MRDDRPTPPPIIGSEGAYEDLDGAQGREVNFRPTRYSQKDLGPVRATIEVTLAGEARTCEMQDVSQNGVAFRWPANLPPPALGEPISSLVVRFDLHDAYRGGALAMSVRDQPGGYVVGASFTDALMDIGDVLHMRDVRSWSSSPRAGSTPRRSPGSSRASTASRASWASCTPLSQRRLGLTSPSPRVLPWHVAPSTATRTPPRTPRCSSSSTAISVPECTRYSYAIDDALRAASPDQWAHLKEFSQGLVHGYLMQAAFIERAFNKPLGYPGDFELMRYMYNVSMEGTTLFSKALHYAIVHQGAGEAVRQRKEMLKRALRTVIEGAKPNTTVRIASIAAGPAYEVAELLRELTVCPAQVELLLFDQDRSALEIAHGRIGRAAARWPAIRVVYRHDSIKRLLKDPTQRPRLGPFDMLFCSGLFDYLRYSTAVTLCQTFYGLLAPGGHAWVGNMSDNPNPCRWIMEQHMDWFLTYRTRDEMTALARAAAPEARIEIMNEGTGINPFVVTQKPE